MSTASDSTAATGLPMTRHWDPERLRRETETLRQLAARPWPERLRGYYRLTGPAWLQSAMTLGAGSAAASVVAGAFYGYTLLWVQPVAMLLGVFMLAALANITLTRGERAYAIVRRELHPALALLWALATVVATVIWHFGQYALLGGAVWDLAQAAGARNPTGSTAVETAVRLAGGLAILAVNIVLTWNYGSKPAGIRLYETALRWLIRFTMLAFLVVVVMQVVRGRLDWGALGRGFFTFQIPDRPGALTTVLGAIGAAVGINMTFLYPYSLLARGWGPAHKGLARFDLGLSLFVPYVVLTSLIIVGMAATVHQPPFGTVLGPEVTPANLKPVQAAQSLAGLLGSGLGRVVFDLGFIGMACGAISAHMVCCGFTLCEMLGLEYTPARYRWFTLTPAVGLLGVLVPNPLWLPVLASALAFTLLPIAYLAFLILNNKRRYLGDAVGRGWRRWAFNAVLVVALGMSVVGAAIRLKTGVVDRLFPPRAASAPAPPAATPEGRESGRE